MDNPDSQLQTPAPAAPLCPHCRQPLLNVAWSVNPDVGLITFFHNVVTCMVTLNCQLVPPAPPQSRLTLPTDLRPRGLG